LTNNQHSFLLIAIMNYKIIIYIITLTLFSAMIGGGAVYIATNYKLKAPVNENSTTSESSSSSSKSLTNSSSISEDKNTSSSIISKSSEKEKALTPEEKPIGQKFTGWLGSTNIEMYLNFKQDKITGKYYNSYDKKWYTLDGNYEIDYTKQYGRININEYDNNLISGNLGFNNQNPYKFVNQNEQNIANQNYTFVGYSIPAGLYYTNTLRTLSGYYSDKTGQSYDLFVSSTQSDIDNFIDETKELEVIKLDSGNPGEVTMFEQNGKYYFTYEDWKIPKDIKVGDKLKITGKIRSFNNPQGFEVKPWVNEQNPGKYESTSQGIFQISDVKKI
jgi:hypothetical protein